MSYQININKFSGPLDLLLQLIEKQELDINEVSLAQVTDQYIEYLKKLEELLPGDLADFLLIAAKLLVIKSRTLLPYLALDPNEEAAAADLERQLRLYKEFAIASKVVQQLISRKKFAFFRTKSLTGDQIIFSPPARPLKPTRLAEIFAQIIHHLEPIINLPQQVLAKTISIKERINQLRQLVLQKLELGFDELSRGAKDKTEIIINFLALLELIKQKEIVVKQDGLFANITIKKSQ